MHTRTRSWPSIFALSAPALLVALLVTPGCSSDLGARASLVELEVALDPEGALVLSRQFVSSPNPPVLEATTLSWIARDADGRVVARGEIPDARTVSFEDALDHREESAELTGATAHFRLRVPRIDGEVEVRDRSGAVLALLPLSARARETGVTSAPLLDADADVLGPPVPIAESATGPTRVLFVPEGYTEAEMPAFRQLAADVVHGLHAMPDYAAVWHRLTFVSQDVRSNESGIDVPAHVASGMTQPAVSRNTAFDVGMGVGGVMRCAFFNSNAGQVAADDLREAAGAEVVVILANSLEWCGCAQPRVAVNAAENPARLTQVVAHELGHALFGLGDEYDSDSATHAPSCSAAVSWPNIAVGLTDLPWQDLVSTTVLPTPFTAEYASVVGAFEGAGYCTTGRYRPAHHCAMRSAYNPFCPVCRREMERRLDVTSHSDAPPSGEMTADGIYRSITVRNRTGAGLWARCASPTEGTGCSGWTWIDDGGDATVESFDGRYMLDNRDYLAGSVIRSTFLARESVMTVLAGDGEPGPTEPPITDPEPEPEPEPGDRCDDTCRWSNDGVCDDGSTGRDLVVCDLGTDCSDCAGAPVAALCSDTCSWPGDGECDDGGPGSANGFCAFGTDCTDCGPR